MYFTFLITGTARAGRRAVQFWTRVYCSSTKNEDERSRDVLMLDVVMLMLVDWWMLELQYTVHRIITKM